MALCLNRVGNLLYLASNTHPNLVFAVNQAAQYTHCPQWSHKEAIKCICFYLCGTPIKGLVFCPSTLFVLICYIDTNFAGSWHYEDNQDPVCVHSWTDYILIFAGCPLLWASKYKQRLWCLPWRPMWSIVMENTFTIYRSTFKDHGLTQQFLKITMVLWY